MHDGRIERLSIEYRYLHPVRGELWLHHLAGAAERDGRGRALRTFGVLRDVTEQKRTEAALQDLSRRLIRAQEEERALLARELHDDLSQRLAVLAIDAGRAELAASGGPAEETLRGAPRGPRDASARTSTPSRTSSTRRSWRSSAWPRRSGRSATGAGARAGSTSSSRSIRSPTDVGAEAALCLFRVAQEALTNVLRHSGARSATVSLRPLDEGLLLAVRDDGTGFDPAAPRAGRSLGLASMRERIHLVKGTLDVESAPGEGTAIVAWVPCELRELTASRARQSAPAAASSPRAP